MPDAARSTAPASSAAAHPDSAGISTPILVAVVGAGAFGREHLAALRQVDRARTTMLVDPRAEAAEQAASEFDVPQVFTDLTTALATGPVDAVIIATPSSSHVDLALTALAAGRHVLIEKPVALSSESLDRLAGAAADRPELVVLPGHVLRHSPPHRRLADAVEAGEIGTVLHFAASRDRPIDHHDRNGGVSPVFFTAIHDIDLAIWITRQTPLRVSATAVHQPDRAAPSVVVALVRTADGGVWMIRTSWALPLDAPNQDLVQVLGTAGALNLFEHPQFAGDRMTGTELIDQDAHFIDCILTGRQSDRVSLRDVELGVRLGEAIERALLPGAGEVDV